MVNNVCWKWPPQTCEGGHICHLKLFHVWDFATSTTVQHSTCTGTKWLLAHPVYLELSQWSVTLNKQLNYNLPMEDQAQHVPSWLQQASQVTHQPRETLNCERGKAPLYKKGTCIPLGLWWEEAGGQTGPNMPNDKHLLEELQNISLLVFIYVQGESNENLKYFLSRNLLNTLWNCRTSWTIRCADPWLISRCVAISFTVTRWFSFTMASTAAMACGVTTGCAWPGRGESVAELMPFMNFLVHLYTCCSDRHASPYWTFICWWISMGFTPSLLKKPMTERCSSLVHVASGAAIFTLLKHCRIAFLHRTATCRPLFKPWVSLLSTYTTIELCFEFLSDF